MATIKGTTGNDKLKGTSGDDTIYGDWQILPKLAIVSLSKSGKAGDGRSAIPTVSPDGNSVSFYGESSTFVTSDTNGLSDIYIKNLKTGVVTLVSQTVGGVIANGQSLFQTFSPDGTKIAFESVASNLVTGDSNGAYDVIIKDLKTGTLKIASTNEAGTLGNGASGGPSFSPDGKSVAFYSSSTNLVANDRNGTDDIFVKNLVTGKVTLVSSDKNGKAGNDFSNHAVFSPDGKKVMFFSAASNLVANDTNNSSDIFLKDLTTGAIIRVSESKSGAQGNGHSYFPQFSPNSKYVFSKDGSKVLFTSEASNLVAGDTNGVADVFMKNLKTGAITRVSTGTAGKQSNGLSDYAVFSPDGNKVAFESRGSNLAVGDSNSAFDVFVKDLLTGKTEWVTHTPSGVPGNFPSGAPVFSPDGKKLYFSSLAGNLVNNDTNTFYDVFEYTFGKTGSGNDILTGGGGADKLIGGGGNDTANYSTSAKGVTVNLALTTKQVSKGDASGDVLSSIENISGSAFADKLTGNGKNNVLSGLAGADKLSGGGGTDTANYSASKTGVTVNLALASKQVSKGDASGDILSSIESVTGSTFADKLTGNSKSNVITGLAGNDTLTGNGGNDKFVFAKGFGKDTITDFSEGKGLGDVIRLSMGTSFDSFAEIKSHASQEGNDTVITFNANTTLTLDHVQKSALVADDFLFV
jgi:Tol biopolymer transport system component